MNTEVSIKSKVKTIYSQFSKAPIYEMVQYLVDENVDAQMLHQLKLIDMKQHKNMAVKSYAEKICEAYERVCRALVTYPSLEFVNNEYKLKKDKEAQFIVEYFGESISIEKSKVLNIIKLGNIGVMINIEANENAEVLIKEIISSDKDINLLTMFLQEITGEDHKKIIQKVCG